MLKKLYRKFKQSISPMHVKVIILGHQKTGTTVIAALLGKISGLEMSNDPFYKIDYGKGIAVESLIKEPDKLKLFQKKHPDLLYKPIIKDPDLIFAYPFFNKYYQNAKYVFVVRDPRDTIRSICNRLNFSGKNQCSISDIKKINMHWELILTGQLPLQKNASQNFVLNLAYRWNLAIKTFLKHQDEMVLIKYEDFMKDKEGCIYQLAKKLRLPQIEPISEYVNIQFQPKGNNKVNWINFFGSKNLEQIETICGSYMTQFGYEKRIIKYEQNK